MKAHIRCGQSNAVGRCPKRSVNPKGSFGPNRSAKWYHASPVSANVSRVLVQSLKCVYAGPQDRVFWRDFEGRAEVYDTSQWMVKLIRRILCKCFASVVLPKDVVRHCDQGNEIVLD